MGIDFKVPDLGENVESGDIVNVLVKEGDEIAADQGVMEIETGKASKEHNVLVNAPHTADVLTSDNWDKPYSREKAAFPKPWLREGKFWPSVGRVDGAYGDRNLVCTCAPIEAYE